MGVVNDYLKTVVLYSHVDEYVTQVAETGDYNPDELRRRLDPVLSMGKAIGRRSALDELAYPSELDDLRMLHKQLRKILGGMTDPKQAVAEIIELSAEYSAHDRRETSQHVYGWRDRLIDDWLAIVDSVDVSRETSGES